MAGKLFKIKSDDNNTLKKLLNDLNIAEAIEEKEIDYNKKWTPEEWYQQLKKRWYFHGSSWYMRRATLKRELSAEEMKTGCNGVSGCISECPFFPPEGRIGEAYLQYTIRSLEEYLKKERDACPICSKGEQHQHNEQEQQPSGKDK